MLLRGVTGENPVILLDDVMSELDPGRQDYLLNRIRGFQVLITCCDEASARRMNGGKLFCGGGRRLFGSPAGSAGGKRPVRAKEELCTCISAARRSCRRRASSASSTWTTPRFPNSPASSSGPASRKGTGRHRRRGYPEIFRPLRPVRQTGPRPGRQTRPPRDRLPLPAGRLHPPPPRRGERAGFLVRHEWLVSLPLRQRPGSSPGLAKGSAFGIRKPFKKGLTLNFARRGVRARPAAAGLRTRGAAVFGADMDARNVRRVNRKRRS